MAKQTKKKQKAKKENKKTPTVYLEKKVFSFFFKYFMMFLFVCFTPKNKYL